MGIAGRLPHENDIQHARVRMLHRGGGPGMGTGCEKSLFLIDAILSYPRVNLTDEYEGRPAQLQGIGGR